MRRSRAFTLFGWFLIVACRRDGDGAVACGRPDPVARRDARERSPRAAATLADLRLLPRSVAPRRRPLRQLREAGGDAGHASRAKRRARRRWSRSRATTARYVEQKCLRWLDPATKLQCAEFDKAADVRAAAR